MTTTVSADLLHRFTLFSDLNIDILEDFAAVGEEITVNRGDVIFESGEKADFVYMIVSGKVEMRVALDDEIDRRVSVSILEEGDLLGWPALVEPRTYELRAVAEDDSRLIKFNGEQTRTLMARHPVAGLKIMESVTDVIVSHLANMRFRFVDSVRG